MSQFNNRAILPAVCLALILACSSPGFSAKTVTVVLRYDDYSSQSPTKVDLEFLDVLRANHLKATLAVIPYDASAQHPDDHQELQPDKVAILQSALDEGLIEVAQHGFAHQVVGDRGEFQGLPYDEQLTRISQGRRMLESALGRQVTSFVPPGNFYDNNTLRIANTLGFRCLSGCQFGDSRDAGSVRLLPEMTIITRLKDCVSLARTCPDAAPIIVVMMHPDDFTEVNKERGFTTLPEVTKTLQWLSHQQDVRVRTLGDVAVRTPWLTPATFRANMAYQYEMRYYPKAVVKAPYGIYLSGQTARALRLRLGAISAILYAGVLIAAAVAGYVISSKLRRVRGGTGVLLVLGILSLLVTLLPLRDLKFEWKGLLMLLACLGLWAGALLPLRRSAISRSEHKEEVREDQPQNAGYQL